MNSIMRRRRALMGVQTKILPAGYTQVEYLESNATGAQAGVLVDTGIIYDAEPTSAEFIVEFQQLQGFDATQYLIGNRKSGTSASDNKVGWGVNVQSDHVTLKNYSSSQDCIDTFATAYTRHIVSASWAANQLSMQIDSKTPVTITGISTLDFSRTNLCIFGIRSVSSTPTAGTPSYFKGRIFYAEAKRDGVSVMKCYPCIRDSDNKPGFFDIINNAFYYGNVATAGMYLTAGPTAQ